MLWTPDQLSSLYTWVDFSDTNQVSLSGFGDVEEIRDKSSNGIDYNVSNSGGIALQYNTTFNGLNVASLTSFGRLNSASSGVPLAGDHSFFCVWVRPTSSSEAFVASGSSGLSSWSLVWGGNDAWWINNNSANVTDLQLPLGVPNITEHVISGATTNRYINGGLFGSNAFSGVGTGWTQIGKSASTNLSYVAEVISFDSALGTDDRQLVEGYLAHKWGLTDSLPVDHPYKSSAPVVEGGGGGSIYPSMMNFIFMGFK